MGLYVWRKGYWTIFSMAESVGAAREDVVSRLKWLALGFGTGSREIIERDISEDPEVYEGPYSEVHWLGGKKKAWKVFLGEGRG